MLMMGVENVSDVMAFPKNARGQDLMCGSPSSL